MISPNIEHLRYFTTVVETGSFTAASRKLGRDRSSVGQAIANLEVDLDVLLFTRNGRNINLTPEGEALYSRARTLLQGYQSFCQFSQNLSTDVESTLTIGIDFFTTTYELGLIDAALTQQFPGIVVNWLQLPTDLIDGQLESGAIDISLRLFQNQDKPEDYHVRHIDNVQMVTVIHREVESEGEMHHSNLRRLPVVVYPDVEKVMRFDRFENQQSVFSPQAALEVVSSKPAWSIFPARLISPESAEYQQITMDTDAPMQVRRIAVWHHVHDFGRAQRWLVENLLSILK